METPSSYSLMYSTEVYNRCLRGAIRLYSDLRLCMFEGEADCREWLKFLFLGQESFEPDIYYLNKVSVLVLILISVLVLIRINYLYSSAT